MNDGSKIALFSVTLNKNFLCVLYVAFCGTTSCALELSVDDSGEELADRNGWIRRTLCDWDWLGLEGKVFCHCNMTAHITNL